ncbi:hypothetical protein RHMOL_Rhmol05G0220100 [Rhododendron molle]|uniref:Uncharacterized protein n=1 Tax=Rhododendron molle TaxID=49168 RepID=A0ACC0NT75_RHOML|nr:hypothetical protein RHMOL_Rhmol05G0220100 [Rhododendron molle]
MQKEKEKMKGIVALYYAADGFVTSIVIESNVSRVVVGTTALLADAQNKCSPLIQSCYFKYPRFTFLGICMNVHDNCSDLSQLVHGMLRSCQWLCNSIHHAQGNCNSEYLYFQGIPLEFGNPVFLGGILVHGLQLYARILLHKAI